jgi:hypothetical protein
LTKKETKTVSKSAACSENADARSKAKPLEKPSSGRRSPPSDR